MPFKRRSYQRIIGMNERVAGRLVGVSLLLLLATVVVIIHFISNNKPDIVGVVLRDDGFYPETITIAPGTTVEWKIEGQNSHWPAADVHPLHSAYPEGGGCIGSKLDACRGLAAGEIFRFKFEKKGKWKMHDHNYPLLGMTVNVGDQTSELDSGPLKVAVKRPDFNTEQQAIINSILIGLKPEDAAEKANAFCQASTESQFRDKLHCYSEVFYEFAMRIDTEFAFKTVFALQKLDKTANSCHVIAHGIGYATYDKEPARWQDSIAKINLSCSYAGIHGILERYSASGEGSFEKDDVPSICGPNPSGGCVHGLGHVLLLQAKNDLDGALALCSSFPSESQNRYVCNTGIFMERMIAPNLYEHGMVTLERRNNWYKHIDEFEQLCRSKSDDIAKACWEMIVYPAVSVFKANPGNLMKFCNTAPSSELVKTCLRKSVSVLPGARNNDLEKTKYMCEISQRHDPGFKGFCYRQLVVSPMYHLPISAMEPLVKYCAGIGIVYRSGCFESMGKTLVTLKTSDEDVKRVCGLAPKEYARVCSGIEV